MESQHVFDEVRVLRDAQDVMAALTAELLVGTDPDPYVMRDTLSGQRYVSVAQHAVMRQMVHDIAELTGIPNDRYLQSLALRVAAKAGRPTPSR